LRSGEALGLARRIGERELQRMTLALPGALDSLVEIIAAENARFPDAVRPFLGREMRLIKTIQHLVVPEMIARVS
jgi:hypothetical protein